MRKIIALAAMAALAGPAAAADIYKCQTPDGRVEFRDRPCAGGAGEKLKPKDNSVGTGSSLDMVRAQDEDFNDRQTAKQRAIDKANRAAYVAGERQWQQERAHQDVADLAAAIRESNGGLPPGYYPYLLPGPQKYTPTRPLPKPKP